MTTYTVQERQAVASTIRRQIGFDTWLAVSARKSLITEQGIKFQYGAKGSNRYILVDYNRGADDYTVRVCRLKRRTKTNPLPEWVQDKVFDGIYADNLRDLVRHINNGEV